MTKDRDEKPEVKDDAPDTDEDTPFDVDDDDLPLTDEDENLDEDDGEELDKIDAKMAKALEDHDRKKAAADAEKPAKVDDAAVPEIDDADIDALDEADLLRYAKQIRREYVAAENQRMVAERRAVVAKYTLSRSEDQKVVAFFKRSPHLEGITSYESAAFQVHGQQILEARTRKAPRPGAEGSRGRRSSGMISRGGMPGPTKHTPRPYTNTPGSLSEARQRIEERGVRLVRPARTA